MKQGLTMFYSYRLCRIKSSAVYRGVPSPPTFGIGSEVQSTNRPINRKKRNLMVPREVHVVDSSSLRLPFGASPRKSESPWTSTAGRMLTSWCEAFPKQDLYSRHVRRDCSSVKPSDGVCGADVWGAAWQGNPAASNYERSRALRGLRDRFCNSLWSYRKYQNAGCGRARIAWPLLCN